MNKDTEILSPMNIIFEKITHDYTLKLAEFNEDPENLFLQLKDNFNTDETEYYKKIKNNKRKIEWLGTRILLKNILGIYTRIFYDNSGNPFLKNNQSISITHSENHIGIIISKNKDIGIDTERITERILRTAHKFIPENIVQYLIEKKSLKEIYLHWCSKETLFKIKGGGGFDFKKDFVLQPLTVKEFGKITAFITKNEKEEFTLSYRFINQNDKFLLLVWKA